VGKAIPMNNTYKILLLDDNKDLLQVVQIILKGQGYESILANNIEEATSKIRIHKPGLILMDVFIEDQDGREFCSKLKHDSDTSYMRVILMSGYDSDIAALPWIGADDFLSKPFDYNDLITRVQKQMEMVGQVYA
jgi:two-component system response regulator VicR